MWVVDRSKLRYEEERKHREDMGHEFLNLKLVVVVVVVGRGQVREVETDS